LLPDLLAALDAYRNSDGGYGVPFGHPYSDTAGIAPHWVDADATVSSLQMTSQLAALARRPARHRADIAGHPWLAAATSYRLDAGAEDEVLHLLDFTPYADAPSRASFTNDAIAADLDRVACQQQPDVDGSSATRFTAVPQP
jgi:hypothetical protein